VSIGYRFYVIGAENRILGNELGTFANDAQAMQRGQELLAATRDAVAVETWERARLVHRAE